ncbi:hypothetical protein [Agrobacterium rosae]|uniref:Uncharacterized protein n=1 Tax=Agrobacterium rosae TaxID=1972867 RepID=A0AAW9FFC4_9HYPH|nr:hypothetical protein [Agrobacterium rosae]MDX8301314.1 hypothetical protein [Agrobacterium rosae]POO57719.1 hypothetical protein CTT39_03455 [Agrobacterium rosae]
MGGKNIKLSDLGWAAATLAFGAIFGFMFGMLGFVVVHGFGMVLVLMLPFFLIQLLFQAAFSRMLLFIISFFKNTPDDTPEPPTEEYPWWRRYSFYMGFPIGAAYGIFSVWSV